MKPLGLWLMLVGSLRLASVWFGFLDIWALRLAVFSKTTMAEIHGRTFGVWTLLTCTLCFLCAFNLENKPLYLATFLSFIYALGHFFTEYLIYQTMAISNLTTVGIFAAILFGGPCPLDETKALVDPSFVPLPVGEKLNSFLVKITWSSKYNDNICKHVDTGFIIRLFSAAYAFPKKHIYNLDAVAVECTSTVPCAAFQKRMKRRVGFYLDEFN